jgi:hypothetical protein
LLQAVQRTLAADRSPLTAGRALQRHSWLVLHHSMM